MIRRVNDDPACAAPADCRATGSGLCRACAVASGRYSAARKKALADPAVRAKMSAASKKAWADKLSWCPDSHLDLYRDLVKKIGAREARQMVEASLAPKRPRRDPLADELAAVAGASA